MSGKKALVTGSTGFLGRNLVEELLDQGWSVIAFCRTPEKSGFEASSQLAVVSGDLTDPASIERAVPEGLDCLFHVAGDTGLWRPNNARQQDINVEGTRHVMRVAKARGVKRVVYTSTVGVYGAVFSKIDETSDHKGADSWINYLKTKAEAEKVVHQAVADGMPAVILNPCNIVGPYDFHNWSRLFRMIDDDSLPGVPPGSGIFCGARAVARAHVAAFEKGRVGECYILGGPQATYREFVQIAAGLLGRDAPGKPTPAFILKTIGRLSLWVSYITRREPDLTPEGATIICADQSIDTEKAARELDYVSPSLEQMVDDAIGWMRAEGLLKAGV